MPEPLYSRILLKVSGEAFSGEGQSLDAAKTEILAGEIKTAWDLGVEVAVVIGGGNIIRGYTATQDGLDRATADTMGMLATVINALALMDSLEKLGVMTRVMTAVEMRQVAEPFIRRRAIRHLEKGRIVIFAAGTGNPYFTTDSAAALRANEIHADVLMKATKVDGIYSADPSTDPSAEFIESITYQKMLEGGYRVIDATAISLCKDNNLPILVFNLFTAGNIREVVLGKGIGSMIR